MPNRQCCICTAPLRGIGCRADPFHGGMCCDDCKDRFVEPVRKIFGAAITHNMLNVLRAIAREARYLMEQRAISNAMAEVAHMTPEQIHERAEKIRDQLADLPHDPSEEAIRDG